MTEGGVGNDRRGASGTTEGLSGMTVMSVLGISFDFCNGLSKGAVNVQSRYPT